MYKTLKWHFRWLSWKSESEASEFQENRHKLFPVKTTIALTYYIYSTQFCLWCQYTIVYGNLLRKKPTDTIIQEKNSHIQSIPYMKRYLYKNLRTNKNRNAVTYFNRATPWIYAYASTTAKIRSGSHWWQRSCYSTNVKSWDSWIRHLLSQMPIGSYHVVGPRNAPLSTHQNCGLNAERSPLIPVRPPLAIGTNYIQTASQSLSNV